LRRIPSGGAPGAAATRAISGPISGASMPTMSDAHQDHAGVAALECNRADLERDAVASAPKR